jgi:hypothetical protein
MSIGDGSPLNIEHSLRESVCTLEGAGLRDMVFGLGDWFLASGASLAATGAGIVGGGSIELGTFDIVGLVWNATADASDIAALSFLVPGDFNPKLDSAKFTLWLRNFDTTGSATANADLEMDWTATIFGTGDATARGKAATTVATGSFAVGTDVTGTAFSGFTKCVIDLSGKSLKAGDHVQIAIGPNEAVGTALAVQMLPGTRFRFGHNAGLNTRSERFE